MPGYAHRIVWILLLAASTATATSQLPADAIVVGNDTAPVDVADLGSRADQALSAIARGDAHRAIDLLQRDPDPLRAELTAARVIDALQSLPPTRVSDQVLDALSAFPIRVFRRHEETAADWFLPLVDVPGKAASLLRLQRLAAQRDALLRQLAQDPASLLQHPKSEASVLVAAIEVAPDGLLDSLVAPAMNAPSRVPGAAWVALAKRRPEPSILDASLVHAAPLDLLPLFDGLPSMLTAADAVDWLDRAARSDELASAAVVALGRLAETEPLAMQRLGEQLGRDRTGASAAYALSRLPAKIRMQRIDALLAKAASPTEFINLALALRLQDTPEARARLKALAADPRVPASLAKELQR